MRIRDRLKAALTGQLDTEMINGWALQNGITFSSYDGRISINDEFASKPRKDIINSSAVVSGIRLISSHVADLMETLHIIDDNGEVVTPNANQKQLLDLFRYSPNEYESATEFFTASIIEYLLGGNALMCATYSGSKVIRIERMYQGSAIIAQTKEEGARYYEGRIYMLDNEKYRFPVENVAHVRLPNLEGKQEPSNRSGFVKGIAETLGDTLKIDAKTVEFINDYYASNVHGLRLAVGSEKKLDDKAIASYRKYLNNSSKRKEQYAFLRDGMKIEKIDISAMDQATRELREFQVKEVARALGISPYLLGQDTKNIPLEVTYRELYNNTLKPHLGALLGAMTHRFLNRRAATKGYRFAINPARLLRGNMAAIVSMIQAVKGDAQSPTLMNSQEIRQLLLALPKVMEPDINQTIISQGLRDRQSVAAPDQGADDNEDESGQND